MKRENGRTCAAALRLHFDRHLGLLCGLGLAVSLARTASAGPVWCETKNGGGDAGKFINLAQTPTGIGPLLGLEGRLDGGLDKEDMFKIKIVDPLIFSARTSIVPLAGEEFITDFDTMLWLFDSNGNGVLANDNATGLNEIGSWLKSPATDGTGQTIVAPGIYYLCITGSGDSALSPLFGIFDIIQHDEISGPDGPGGALPLNAWRGTGPTGHYMVHLQGAEFAEVPAPGALGLGAAALLFGRRRRRH